METRAWRGAIAGLGAVALLAAACGSTNKLPSAGKHGGSTNVLGGLPGTSSVGGPNTAANPSGGPASGGSGTSGGSTSAGHGGMAGGGASQGTSSGPAGSAGVTSKFVPASAPGITNTTINIGVGYSSQSAQGDKAIGAAGAAPSYDFRNVFNAVANYANSHGGFAGRRLQPLYYDYNLTTDQNTQDQSSCAYWTQDNKSFAVMTDDDILYSCAQNAGSVALGAPAATAATFRKYSHLVDPDAIALDRLGTLTANGLYKAGYFTGKLGLVTWDTPDYRATISNGYVPALSAHHITPSQIAYIGVPQTLGAVGDMSAAVSSAVTKFKSLGIDHVIVQDGKAGVWAGDGLTLEWMNQAKSQGYYPRYGMNGYNNPGASINPSDEMNNGLAIDWADYDPKYDQGFHQNQARNLCFQIEAQAGYPVSSGNINDEGLAAQACDAVFFLQRVVNGLPSISADAFIQQAETLGTSFQSSFIYGTKLASGRRDGADEIRNEEYFSSCSCLHYLSSPYYPD